MKIIQPHKIPSRPVESYSDIAAEATEMLELVNKKHTTGYWSQALAISHAQVSTKPYAFFVVNKKVSEVFDGNTVIINPRILEATNRGNFKEACMSYPFRQSKNMSRYFQVHCSYQVKGMFGLKTYTKTLEGLPAIVMQHEVDHAHGKCIYD